MSESNSIVIHGYSGHSYVVLESIRRLELNVIGYVDLEQNETNPYGLNYLGNDDSIRRSHENVLHFVTIGNNAIRKKLIIELYAQNKFSAAIIDPSSTVSSNVRIEPFTFVAPNSTINPLVIIGQGAIINSGSIIEHECKIGNYAHIGPGSILCGNVHIGDNSFVGAGSTIIEGITIGDNVTIGAGSIVIQDIPDNGVWVGNPARKLNNKE